jgi:hypothetical protein
MTAVFMGPSALVGSSVSLYLAVFVLVSVVAALAPRRVTRDRRAVALLLILIVAVVIGQPTYAAYTTICDYAWWAIECWFR